MKVLTMKVFLLYSCVCFSEIPAEFYCQQANREHFGAVFYDAHCLEASIFDLEKQPNTTGVANSELYHYNSPFYSKKLLDTFIQLLKIESAYQGSNFILASRYKTREAELFETLSFNLLFSDAWSAQEQNNLKEFIGTIQRPHVFAINFNDSFAGGTSETMHFLIVDQKSQRFLHLKRLMYLD